MERSSAELYSVEVKRLQFLITSAYPLPPFSVFSYEGDINRLHSMAIIITKDTLADINLSEKEFLIDFVCYLYDKKRLSMGKARKLAGLNLIDFQKELAKREVNIRYSDTDLDTDLKNLGIELS